MRHHKSGGPRTWAGDAEKIVGVLPGARLKKKYTDRKKIIRHDQINTPITPRHEHKGDYQTLLKMCGRVGPQTPNVETATNNSAELVAFTRALQWAKQSVHTRDPNTPVVLRYDSCYAALIASGSWKAHAHKALAKEARKAWDDLLASKGDERLWLRHVKGHSRHTHNNTADSRTASPTKDVRGGRGWKRPHEGKCAHGTLITITVQVRRHSTQTP